MQTLIIKELTFSAAHYLPGHPKCGVIHGHTFFVRNLEVQTSKFVDFGVIKEAIRNFDHKLFIPRDHAPFWVRSYRPCREVGIELQGNTIEVNGAPTVENISVVLTNSLKVIDGVEAVRFELYEGPNQGVKVV